MNKPTTELEVFHVSDKVMLRKRLTDPEARLWIKPPMPGKVYCVESVISPHQMPRPAWRQAYGLRLVGVEPRNGNTVWNSPFFRVVGRQGTMKKRP